MTSTPSATAESIAASRSLPAQTSSLVTSGSGPAQHALYIATFAAGATPEILPKSIPLIDAGTLSLPAAVLAVCEPCPSPSRGET